MDIKLFSKHLQVIKKRNIEKQNVISCVESATGIILEESEITLSKKTVTISTTSVKKSSLVRKNYKEVLIKNGYIVN